LARSAQAKIDVIIGGLREVAALEGRLESIQATINAINKDPVDLNLGGRGRSRDLSGKLSKNVNDLVRNFDKFGKSFSSVNKQAVLFGDLMSQTALKSTGEFKKQDVAVKNLATAYTTATSEAARFERQQINLIRTSKGLQASTQREIEVLRRRAKVSRLRERKRRGQNLQQDLALGVGFPLLFGGGAGSVVGGAAGAIAGGGAGGFGLQILGSAIGQQVDAFIQATTEAGVALTSTGGALDFVREKALFSSAKAEDLAAKLEEQGDAAELSALLTDELSQKIGNEGVDALFDLGTETSKVTKLWNELTIQLQALIAGPLSDFLSLIGDLLKEQVQFNRLNALRKDLAGTEAGQRLEQRISTIKGQGATLELLGGQAVADPFADTRTSTALTGKVAEELFKEFGGFRPEPKTKIPVTGQDIRRFSSGAKKDKLPGLEIEIDLQERLLALDKQIAQATLDENDKIRSILEKEKIRETLAANIDKIKAKGLSTELQAAEIELARVDAAQKIQDIDIKTAQTESDKAKKVQETVENLQAEGELLQARLTGDEQEVQLKQQIAEATKGLGEEDAQRVEKLIRGNAELKKQVEAANRMQQIYDQIGSAIADGVVNTLSAAVDQTKSLADAAANTLKNIANILLKLGVNTLLTGLFPGVGLFKNLRGFASGGRPPVGKPSVVGERGPELFVPRSSGTIVPNHALGGSANVTVNVDASGSSVEGSANEAAQLGKAIGLAVQQELIKQKRPGGLLTT
jgi:hypothetical protein|tara:strand:- start:5955 stop:8201 length:2247 start_codon:yes stop_codon:yes gene_type:complete